ncbi:MAG: ABC transporter substrate-binding protein [bacterium]|nr:ABC transporter substrate-binding protein [bacterium]
MSKKKGLGRRDFLKTAGKTIGAAGLALAGGPMFSMGESETLKIGYLPITDAAPLLIAHARGYFHEEGLKVAKPLRVRGWSALTESFLTGKFNITHMLLPIPIWMRFNNKVPVKILAWNHTNGSALTVRADSGINGFADLGGKQVAVPYWYSMHNVILQMGLRKFGLKPVIRSQRDKLKPDEVNIFILKPPEMPASLLGRKIDGYIVAEPFNAIAEMRIGARIMRFTGDMWKNHPCCVVVMNENLARSRPVFTQKVINAVVRAQLWMTHNMEESAKILSRDGGKYLPIPEDVLLRVFTTYDVSVYGKAGGPKAIRHPGWGIGRIGFQPYPYPSATCFIIKEMRNTLMEGNTAFLKKLAIDFAVKDLVDDSFVKKAIMTVGGPGKFKAIAIGHPWDREEVIEL